MLSKKDLKKIWKKTLTSFGTAKAAYRPNHENLRNNAQTKFFRAEFSIILSAYAHSNLNNLRFWKSYGRNTRKTK